MDVKDEIRYRTLDHVDLAGRRVAVRVDLNSPLDPKTGLIRLNERFRAHAVTIGEMIARGARVVVLAHQGRRGDPDFTDLSQHARLLSRLVGREVRFVPDVAGDLAVKSVKALEKGEVILLDNVRKLEDEDVEKPPEEHLRSTLPSRLAPLLDIFVLDAFSVAHRAHASVVGLAAALPTYAGRALEKELEALNRLVARTRKVVFMLGGNKPKECLSALNRFVIERRSSIVAVLTGGVVGQLFTKVRGYSLGEDTEVFLVKKKYIDLLDTVSSVDSVLGEVIRIPVDFAYESGQGVREEVHLSRLPCPGPIQDIGSETIREYSMVIGSLEPDVTVIVKGPMGMYEKPAFRESTERLYMALAKTRASTLIGGGDSVTAIEMLGFKLFDFTFVSLGGGALISYLAGEPLPGLQVLSKEC
jgi:phosphoglycerate kinase